MKLAFLPYLTISFLVGLPFLLALHFPEKFWRLAGRLKRWIREDLERKYGREEADQLLGPPLPYEFLE